MSRSVSPAVFQAAHRGESAALDELLGVWTPAVYEWCARLGGPHVDAEDAALSRLGLSRADLAAAAVNHSGSIWSGRTFIPDSRAVKV